MDDIKLLIKISNKTYETIQNGDYCGIISAEVYNAIKNGIPQVTETITEFADRCRECGKQKRGKWIEVIDEIDSLGNKTWHHKCSICENENSGWGDYKYCPNCGAKMVESEGSNDT